MPSALTHIQQPICCAQSNITDRPMVRDCSGWAQYVLLIRRYCHAYWRNPAVNLSRLVTVVATSFITGSWYWSLFDNYSSVPSLRVRARLYHYLLAIAKQHSSSAGMPLSAMPPWCTLVWSDSDVTALPDHHWTTQAHHHHHHDLRPERRGCMQPLIGSLFGCMIVIGFVNMLSFAPLFVQERAAFARERARGMCGVLPWASAMMDVEAAFIVVQVLPCVRSCAELLAVIQRQSPHAHIAMPSFRFSEITVETFLRDLTVITAWSVRLLRNLSTHSGMHRSCAQRLRTVAIASVAVCKANLSCAADHLHGAGVHHVPLRLDGGAFPHLLVRPHPLHLQHVLPRYGPCLCIARGGS